MNPDKNSAPVRLRRMRAKGAVPLAGPVVLRNDRQLFESIAGLIERAKRKVASTINEEMVALYWTIGKTIKEEIIKSDRAEYGKQIVNAVSSQLTQRYGKGFSNQNLWHMIKFCEKYPILSAVRREFEKLGWTHIKAVIYIEDELKRKFYTALCQKEHWSTRVLRERIDSMLYERTALSKLPEKTIEKQLQELKEEDKMTPDLVFRDPYVLDFLQLADTYSEKDPENAILNSLEKFILELGADFYFREHIELLFLQEDRIKVADYLTKLPSKEIFAEKLHKAVENAQLRLEENKEK